MIQAVIHHLSEKGIPLHTYSGIHIVTVANASSGLELAAELLEKSLSATSLLLLSGGRTPKELYETLGRNERMQPGAVGMIDERYGEKFHENSNERMMDEAGLLRYLTMRAIPFYPILTDQTRVDSAESYDKTLRELFTVYSQIIGVLGIGMDGHTAGIPATNSTGEVESTSLRSPERYVGEYNDTTGPYRERVTMTFTGLALLDFSLVLVFGADKVPALQAVFSEGSEVDIPGRFFKRPAIAKKTLFITDQNL